jgi:hypothetical protein
MNEVVVAALIMMPVDDGVSNDDCLSLEKDIGERKKEPSD